MKVLKSILTSLLLFSFLSSTLGIKVEKHYCRGLLADIGIFFTSDICSEEGCCMAEREDSCCTDETEIHQLEIEVEKEQQQILQEVSPLLVAILCSSWIVPNTNITKKEGYSVFHISKIPLYKRFKRYTLYA